MDFAGFQNTVVNTANEDLDSLSVLDIPIEARDACHKGIQRGIRIRLDHAWDEICTTHFPLYST